jgi:membrane protein DedA with SNARE-associated domain
MRQETAGGMLHFNHQDFQHLLSSYGYWAVMGFVGIESIGIPFPGETMLLAAAVYAGTTHQLDIFLVVAAASAGAILGDNVGFWVGRELGYEAVLRYGRYVRINHKHLKLGMYLFSRHGGKVVFFGRFVAVLRTFAAFLAGVNQMEWRWFLVCNVAGGVVWAAIIGFGGYQFGKAVHHILSEAGFAIFILALLCVIAGFVLLRRNQARLEAEAEAAFPGPLAHHIGKEPPANGDGGR